MANETKLNMTLLLRRAAFADDCVLAAGEPGYHTGTKEFKIGDGTTTWANLPFANKAQIEALIKVVDDKVAALDGTYATDKELEDGLALKADLATYNEYVATRQLTDEQINKSVNDVDAKFASYTTTTDQNAIDAEQDRRLGVLEDTYATKTEVQEAEGRVNESLKNYYTESEADAKFETIDNVNLVRNDITEITKDGGLIDNAKSAVIGTADDAAVANTVYGAKKYAKDLVDAIPAQVDYTVTCTDEDFDATESTPAFKRHTLMQKGNPVCTIDIPRDLVVKSGRVDEATNELVLVLVNDEEIRVDVSHLIEYVTGGTAADGIITVTVDDNFVTTATIADGKLPASKFDSTVDVYVDGRIDDKIATYNTTTVAPIAAKVEGWDATKTTVDTNKATWDLAGTAVQQEAFNTFKSENTKAIEDAQAAAEQVATDFNTAMDTRVAKLENNEYGYATTTNVATAKQEAIDAAKLYADGLDHEDTTYTVAATANALEFTVTPNGKGEAQTVTLVAPTVDVGVTAITTDDSLTVDKSTGAVKISHADKYKTGKIEAAAGTEEPNFLTSVTIDQGHVTSATVQTLRSALESMTFVLDGGTSAE